MQFFILCKFWQTAVTENDIPLRALRRRKTASDIQLATLTLILERGLAGVTNEMIASRAGISLRTFFNYYPNKEAAAVGTPPDFRDESLERFANGTGSLLDDLHQLTKDHVRGISATREVLDLLGQVWRKEPSLLLPLHAASRGMQEKLQAAMLRRMGTDRHVLAEALCEVYFVALVQTFRRWSTDPDMPRERIADEVISILGQVGSELTGGPKAANSETKTAKRG